MNLFLNTLVTHVIHVEDDGDSLFVLHNKTSEGSFWAISKQNKIKMCEIAKKYAIKYWL